MNAITTLLSSLSVEGIILIMVLFATSVKFLGELFEWGYGRLKKYFNIKGAQEQQHEEIMRSLGNIDVRLDTQEKSSNLRQEQVDKISNQLESQNRGLSELKHVIDEQSVEVRNMQEQVDVLNERAQDSTRAYLIDKRNRFKKLGGIDDSSLQDLERRFMYYKAAGGDTFIDNLMQEVRALPHLTAETLSEQTHREED